MPFFIPTWVTNVTYLVDCFLAGFQLRQLYLPNPLPSVQFIMIVVSMLMMLVVAFFNDVNPWLSLVFFAVAAGNLAYLIRAHRFLPPRQKFE